MVIVLTPEQELAERRKSYEKLVPGKLFNLGGRRYFIAVEKLGDRVEVIELEAKNVQRIVRGEPCVRTTLHFDEMSCLNVRDQKEELLVWENKIS
jgi:hypothetical protein